MTPTSNLIEKLRLLLNDKDKKSFTDEELNLFLEEADCIYCAASQGWICVLTKKKREVLC